MRWQSHVRFEETDRWQQQHGTPVQSHLGNAFVYDIRQGTLQSVHGEEVPWIA